MLAVTEAQIYTQVIQFERNDATVNLLGQTKASDWQPSVSCPGFLWWWKGSKSTAKSASAEYARPQVSVDVTGATIVIPLGVDVIEEDRVMHVEEGGEIVETGPFRILSVNRYSDHVEISLERP